MYAIRWGRHYPLPLPSRDACNGYGLTCPLKNGYPVHLTFTGKVPKLCPVGNYGMEAVLKDKNGEAVVCGIVDLKVS